MKNDNEYRVTLFFNEEEYKKLKYIAEYLKKYSKDNGSIPKLSTKLLLILIEALDDKKIEARTSILSTIDKESKEKNFKTILEKIQNDQDNDNSINSTKIIENLAFLSNVKRAIKKMEENNIGTKGDEKTENENKEYENKENIEKETNKAEENKTADEKQPKETQTQEEKKIETKVENKEIENKKEEKDNEEDEIIRFPDL
jgi:cobalamin biosynthesis protein CobT